MRELLAVAVEQLRPVSETPWLDALVLLEHTTDRKREKLLADLPDPIAQIVPGDNLQRFKEAIERRSRGVPVAYITGIREFMGLEFAVGPGVLVPRPETEILVDEAVQRLVPKGSGAGYHDCCTGSGCVVVAVVRHCLDRGVTICPGYSDIDKSALSWARDNVRRLVPEITAWDTWCGPWLEDLSRPVDVITANPPYLTDTEAEDVLGRGWGEPFAALGAGSDGLRAYRHLVPQAVERLNAGGYLLVECGAMQAAAVQGICADAGFVETSVIRDHAGKDRVVVARKDDGRDDKGT